MALLWLWRDVAMAAPWQCPGSALAGTGQGHGSAKAAEQYYTQHEDENESLAVKLYQSQFILAKLNKSQRSQCHVVNIGTDPIHHL